MRFGHFSEVKENPERSLFDQNGNFLRKESVHTVTENLKSGAKFLKKAGTFTPDPAAKAATENASSILEAGENARKMLEAKKAKLTSKDVDKIANAVAKAIEADHPELGMPTELKGNCIWDN